MKIRITAPKFKPCSKTVRFGYEPEFYQELFDKKEHTVNFYPTKTEGEFLVCLNEIERDARIGSLLVLDLNKPGNKKHLTEALINDYGLDEDSFELIG